MEGRGDVREAGRRHVPPAGAQSASEGLLRRHLLQVLSVHSYRRGAHRVLAHRTRVRQLTFGHARAQVLGGVPVTLGRAPRGVSVAGAVQLLGDDRHVIFVYRFLLFE